MAKMGKTTIYIETNRDLQNIIWINGVDAQKEESAIEETTKWAH